MKINKLFLGLATIAAAVFSFSSCSSEDVESTNVPQKANQIRLITNVALTRSVSQTLQESQIASGIHVGAFVTTTGSTTAFLDNATNNDLTADGDGNLNVGTDKEMYFPKNGNVNIYAYAPYNSNWNTLGEQTFTIQTNQSEESAYCNSDLIWATPLTNQVSQEEALALAFNHKLSKINVTITNNRTGLSLNGATVSILNTVPSVSINLSTGALGSASGTATEITAATLGENETTASAIIVPQVVAAGKFIKIVTNAANNNNESITLYAKLATAKTLAENHKYNYTVTINDNSVELKLGSTTIGSWTEADETAEAEEETPAVTYGIGDYVLKDGTLIKAADYAANSSNVAAIIFSTTVSSTDATAGYNAYAMGLSRRIGRTFPNLEDYKSVVLTSAVTGYYAGYSDLDGRTKTAQMLAHAFYTTGLDDSGKSSFVANMSGYTPAFDDAAKTGDNATVSDWFLPSFGQMRQILSEFGGVTFVVSGEDDPSVTNTVHTINGTALTSWGSNNPFYTSESDALTTLVNNLNSHVSGMFAEGNICFATSTENGGSSHVNKFWFIGTSGTDNNYWMGKGMQRGNTVSGGNNYNTIPVVAVKLPSND